MKKTKQNSSYNSSDYNNQDKHESKKIYVLVVLLLIVSSITFIVHYPSLYTNGTCFDHEVYLTSNNLIKNPGISSAVTIFKEILNPSSVNGYYQPLSMISLMIDYSIAKSDSILYVYHFTSLIFHILNTILIAFLLFILFRNPYISALLALIFGVHPITVESIIWIAERKTLIGAFFGLSAVISYLMYTKKQKKYLYILTIVFYILCMLSKPIAIGLPFVLILLDYWPLKNLNFENYKKFIIEKIPLFVIMLISAFVTFVSQRNRATISAPEEFLLTAKVLKFLYQIPFYLGNIIYPQDLTAHYSVPGPFTVDNPKYYIPLIVTLAIVLILLATYNKIRSILSGFMIFTILLLPTMGIFSFTDVLVRDNYIYMPSIGLLLILGAFFNYLWNEDNYNLKIMRGIIISGFVVTAIIYSSISREYIPKWVDTETYFKHMAKLDPYYPHLFNMLAKICFETNRLDEAISNTLISVKLDPKNPEFYGNLGLAYERKGEIDTSIEYFKKAVAVSPNNLKPILSLGILYNKTQKFDAAIEIFKKVIELSPDNSFAYYALAFAQINSNKVDDSFENLKKSVSLTPNNFDSNYLLAQYYFSKNQLDKSKEVLDNILNLNLTQEQRNNVNNTLQMLQKFMPIKER